MAANTTIESDGIRYASLEALLESTSQAETHPAKSRNTGKKTVYAIAFDLDTSILAQTYHVPTYNNAYADIRNHLVNNHGFSWQQGSVYFGGDKVNAVTCVIAVIDLTNEFSWFAASVRDIRMLRIEEENDLMPAIQQAVGAQPHP